MKAWTYGLLIGAGVVVLVGLLAPTLLPALVVTAVFVGFISLLVWSVRRFGGGTAAAAWYCPNCGIVGTPTTRVKGSFFIEVILWFCFLIPGLIYSVWRLTTKDTVCPSCGAPNMIPADSPRARAGLKRDA